ADADAEGARAGAKSLAAVADRIDRAFGRVDLPLVLEADDSALGVEDESADQQSTFDEALGAENGGDSRLARRVADALPCLFEKRAIRLRDIAARAPIPGNVTLGEAHD